MFVIAQLIGWFYIPSYNESNAVHYLTLDSKQSYDIPLSSFLPTFAICDQLTQVWTHPHYESCNNRTNWNIQFMQETDG